mgnify:CR=1 FL=1
MQNQVRKVQVCQLLQPGICKAWDPIQAELLQLRELSQHSCCRVIEGCTANKECGEAWRQLQQP